MTNIAIRVQHISKEFQIGTIQTKQKRWWLDVLLMRASAQQEKFVALDDLSFDVKRGEVLGIVGHNGAGKSTLLKILSRITQPSQGDIELFGRVGSLLEVGTGFHPHLTGRENVYMNGVIMGMTRREIERKFDEIVAFAGVEKFIDTQVRHYSSGMYVRLAFAVAAFLEPEILIVDEVLSVGDAEFQKRCLGKMQDVMHEGRTVLFVSHNLMAVRSLCTRSILLNQGKLVLDAPTEKVLEQYLLPSESFPAEMVWDNQSAPGDEIARLLAIRIRNDRDETTSVGYIHEPIVFEYEIERLQNYPLTLVIGLYNQETIHILTDMHTIDPIDESSRGIHVYRCEIPAHFLATGVIATSFRIVGPGGVPCVRLAHAFSFEMLEDSTLREPGFYHEWGGVVRPHFMWTRKEVKDIV